MLRPRTDPTLREKSLYHQVHPLKLATDISTAIVGLVLLAHRRLLLALVAMFLPPVVVSVLLLQFEDVSKTRDSAVGAYLRRYMTPGMQAVRLAGDAVASIGAWFHLWWLIPVGLAIIVWGWSGNWLLTRAGRPAARRQG